ALSMHQHLVAAAAYNHRQGRPGKKLLERVAADEAVLISTDANDWMDSNGVAKQTDGGFRVSAKKPFCRGSLKGGGVVSSAPFEDAKEGWQVLHFAVPSLLRACRSRMAGGQLGMRATGSQTIILDNVFVPDDAITLRRRGRFHPATLS